MSDKRKISLVLADVDGTLGRPQQKVLTPRATAACAEGAARRAGNSLRQSPAAGRLPAWPMLVRCARQIDDADFRLHGGLFVHRRI